MHRYGLPDGGGVFRTREGTAVAVIAPQFTKISPGIDIERICTRGMLDTALIFTSETERAYLSNCELDYTLALLITFSAKESLYKALYPQVRNFFGFSAAQICYLNVDSHSFCVELTEELAPTLPKGHRTYGYYTIYDEHILTVTLV